MVEIATNAMKLGTSGLVEGNSYSAGENFVVSGFSMGIMLCGGNILLTSAVISIPGVCSNYFVMLTFRTFVNKFLLSNAYNHSKQTLDVMQTTTNKNCKEKETCIYSKGGVWLSSLYKRNVKSYAETISLSSNYAGTHIFQLSHLLAVSRK